MRGIFIMKLLSIVYNFLWGDLFRIPLPGGDSIGITLLILILIPAGIFFTIRTRGLPFRLFPEMLRVSVERRQGEKRSISGLEALIVSTATRVGMGNLVGVVAALSVGGAGAVFWMWVTAMIGSATAFAEGTLAQMHKTKDPLYGGYRGGPAYYIHDFYTKITKKKKSILAVCFAASGLLCWCGISQVVSNSVTSAFSNAFSVPPLLTTIVITGLAALIVLRKNMTVHVLDVIVPIMAAFYFALTIYVIVRNIGVMPRVFERIFSEAFGFRQVAGGSLSGALLNGIKRGLFSNEAGSGSAPCAAAAADVDHPVKAGLLQGLGVFIDTIVICSCTAMLMLTVPQHLTDGLQGMELLQAAMGYHFGSAGIVFISAVLFLFSFSTFIGVLYYARSNVAYLFGDNWISQTLYKILALVMLFIGGLAAYTFVWDLGDVGIGLMTIFNMTALLPLSGQVIRTLKEYEQTRRERRAQQEQAGRGGQKPE
ncbi:MAG TPA: amino acid carrier protein [Lachnospiraceae bacterium]|nr:amino acid carrier protein [Lachnospiraceae bacterium]